jgi:hypothetical protein
MCIMFRRWIQHKIDERLAGVAEADIVRADPDYRSLVWLLYVSLILAGIVAGQYVVPAWRSHLENMPMMDLLTELRTTFTLILLSFSPAALYLIHVGRRTLLLGCYPYPGRKVMFDTPVLRGDAARRRGKAFVALGTVFLVLMALSAVYTFIRMSGWIHNPMFREFYGPATRLVRIHAPITPVAGTVHDQLGAPS